MSQVYHIELGYQSATLIKALPPEQYAELRAEFPEFELAEDQTSVNDWCQWRVHGTIADLDKLARFGLEPTVKRIRGQFLEKVFVPTVGVKPPPEPNVVNISIPNQALFAVQTVDYLEDYCTNELQNWLDSGWRIVAVCPPNDTRRPTYIVGHFDKEPKRPNWRKG